VERLRSEMVELPRVMAARFVREYGLSESDAAAMTQNKATAFYFLGAVNEGGPPKLVSNWIMGELSRYLKSIDGTPAQSHVSAIALANLVRLISDGVISNSAAKQVFEVLWNREGHDVQEIVDRLGLKQMSDTGALEKIIDEVIAANADNVAQFRAGKDKAFNALVGQAMKATQGKANPSQVNELLRSKLAG
ncbi:MAG: Asp-tRNA(Asn)/Glu-tRNA(Gln) amidotransferase GatCAB subunit B, partial [Ramlibacter sp.]